ncbi:DUF447 domain-containing protein [Methanocaldococcus sp.]
MIYEVVIATKKDDKDNKAPIGIYFKDNKIIMHLFYGSHTYYNLLTENYFSVNVVHPIELVKAVLEDEDDYLYYNNKIKSKIPYLKNSYYVIFCKVISRKFIEKNDIFGKSKMMIVEGEEIDRVYLNNLPKPYNRADGLLVEMAVIYSRLTNKNVKLNEKDKKKFINDLNKYFSIIKKVGSLEHKKLAEIMLKEIYNLK